MATQVPELFKKWQKVEDNSLQEKSGEGFTTMLTLTAKPVAAGKYRISFNGEGRTKAGNLNRQCKFRVKVDGVTKMIRTLAVENEWNGSAGWDFQAFSEGDTPVVIVEVQRFGSGAGNVEVQKLKLSIERMEE